MKRLVSKNRSTQLTKQVSSPLENRVEGVPVMHLAKKKSAKVNMGNGQEVRRTHLSQHILVKVWIDCWTRACACSRSRKVWSSFCSGVNKSVSIRIPSKKNDGNSALTCVASSKRSAMAGRGRNLARKYCLLAGALFQSASGLRSERIRKLSFVSRYFPFLGAS
jgi:hypothetical protein